MAESNNIVNVGYWRDLTLAFPDGSSATVTVDLPTYRSAVEEKDQSVIDEILKNYMDIQKQGADAVSKSSRELESRPTDACGSTHSSESTVCQSRPEEATGTESDESNVHPSDTVNWKHEEVLLLISLYTEHQEMFSSSLHKSFQVWKRISGKMMEMGYSFSGGQCDKKFRSLKYRYKTIVDANGKSGRGRRKWEFFEAMDELMAGDPSVKPAAVVSSSKVTSKPPLPHVTGSKDSGVRALTPPRTPVRAPSPPVRAPTPPGRANSPAMVSPNGEPQRKRRRSSSEAPQWFSSFAEEHNRQVEALLEPSNRIAAAAEERNHTLSRLVDAIIKKNNL